MTNKEQITMPKTPTLEQLEQEQAEAQARVERARIAAMQIRQRAEQRRADAQREYDEALLRDWPDEHDALQQDVTDARERLRAAILADPVWQAYREFVLASHRTVTRTLEVHATMNRVHGTQATGASVPTLQAPTWEELQRIVYEDATAAGRDEASAREQRRADIGEAAADLERKRGAAE